MKKRELIQAVAAHTGVDTKTAGKVVEGTIDVILASVAKGVYSAGIGFEPDRVTGIAIPIVAGLGWVLLQRARRRLHRREL